MLVAVLLCAKVAFYPVDAAIQRYVIGCAKVNSEAVVVRYGAARTNRIVGSPDAVK